MKFETAQYYKSYGTVKQLEPSELPEIAFSGRSNVGKSSLLNKILNRKNLARVSATPGKTITVNFFKLDTAMFVDLPGYGYAQRSLSEQKRWSDLVEGYFTTNRDIRLVLQLVDMRHKPSKDDLTMLHFMNDNDIPFVIVLTKADKLNKTQKEKQLEILKSELDFLPEDTVKIPFSALKGDGVEKVREIIKNVVE